MILKLVRWYLRKMGRLPDVPSFFAVMTPDMKNALEVSTNQYRIFTASKELTAKGIEHRLILFTPTSFLD